MAKEIERKFLVNDDSWKKLAEPVTIKQGFLSTDKERVVRIRIKGVDAYMTVKSKAKGLTRGEWEYEIPLKDAEELLTLCFKPIIEKTRTTIPIGDIIWEVDEFFAESSGLVVAEVELDSEEQSMDKPSWIGREVSSDARFFNSNLIKNPFKNWKDSL